MTIDSPVLPGAETAAAPRETTSRVVRAIAAIARISAGVAGVLTVAMCLNIVADVVARNVFGTPLPGTTGLVSDLWMPGISLLALGLAQLRNEQITVTLLLDEAGGFTRAMLDVLGEVFAGVLVLWLFMLSLDATVEAFRVGVRTPVPEWLPVWPGHAMVTVSLAVCLLAAVARLVLIFTKRGLGRYRGDY